MASLILPLLERVIDRVILLDTDALEQLRGMTGKVLTVELKGLDKTIYVLPHANGVRLIEEYDGPAQLKISGTPLALLAMARNRQPSQATFTGEVEISGDLGLSRRLQNLLTTLDIDWEEILSQYVGDVAAHQLYRTHTRMLGWFKDTRQTMLMNAVEYVKYELQLVPEVGTVTAFNDAVDILRADVDRLEARIKRLAQK